ncbi:MAG: insulinase family protein [Victivallales bacterium]|nr:insulinase family protein [Victivallales bacterium]
MFTPISTTEIVQLGITARRFRHPCGMEVLSLECDDTENLCAASFLTIPEDSSGVQHIIEHCVCEGSFHFPVKSPFSELERTSMATLLNAFTYNDHTVFPFASVNPTDFFNIFEVYWDCVFHPTLKPEVFRQEGWHLAFQSGRINSKLIENGIVLNEMNATMAELDSVIESELLKKLLPEFPMSKNSGGDPEQIVRLSYEDFLAYYRSRYVPSNCKILLYGNIPTEEKLDFIERHLVGLDMNTITASRQPKMVIRPWGKTQTATVPVVAQPSLPVEEQTAWGMAWLVDAHASLRTRLLADLLDSILFDTEGAPLKKAILESGLADDLYSNSGFETETPQVVFTIGATGLNKKDIPALRKTVMDTLRDFAMKGPTERQLKTAFRQLKIEKLEIDGAFLYNLIDDVFDGWIHDNDPLAILDCAKALDKLEALLQKEPHILMDFIQNNIIGNNHAVDLQFIPDFKLGTRKAKEKEKRLQILKAGMSKEQRQTIAEQQRQLLERQTMPDSPEALATLPALSRKDISPLPLAFHPERLTSDGQPPILSENVRTNGLHYLKIAFPLEIFNTEELDILPFFTSMLNHVGTARHDYATFDDLLAAAGADMEFDYSLESNIAADGRLHGLLSCRFSALDETWAQALDYLNERLTSTVFSERKRIMELLRQRNSKYRLSVQEDAHLFTRMRAGSGLTTQATCIEHWQGLTHYLACRHATAMTSSKLTPLLERFEAMMVKLGTATPLVITHVGPASGRAALLDRWQLPSSRNTPPFAIPREWPFPQNGRTEAYPLSCDVGATALYHRAPTFASSDCAALCVYAELLGNGPVWERIRIQRGAYGAACRYFPFEGLWYIGSARDPNPLASMDILTAIDNADHIWTDRELEGAIITQLKEAPPRPARRCDTLMFAELTGFSYDLRLQHRQQLLQLSLQDVRQAAEHLRESVGNDRNLCVAASRPLLKKSSLNLISL